MRDHGRDGAATGAAAGASFDGARCDGASDGARCDGSVRGPAAPSNGAPSDAPSHLAPSTPFAPSVGAADVGEWTPAIDAFQRGNEFIIRADVPGMTRNDLSVEIGDDSITIRGERKHDEQGEEEGVYWSERSYGTFYRVVPLPPGAIADSAKAKFTNGVLEVTVQAPSAESRRGRKVAISGT